MLHGRFGTLPLREVMAPAIALAQAGLVAGLVHDAEGGELGGASAELYPSSAAVYLPNGLPPVAPYQGRPGYFRLGALPDTLDRLAHAGLRDFYEGDVAASIAADMKALGGVLDADGPALQCEARITRAPGGGVRRAGRCSWRAG